MAAYAALVSLLNNIEQMMNHPRLSTSLEKKKIQPLVEKAAFLLDFIEKYNYCGSRNKEAQDLETHIASAAHAAEDVIESHIVDQIHAGTYLVCSLDLQQIMEDMDAVMEKAAEVKEKQGRGSREVQEAPAHSRSAALMETRESSTSTQSRMVGLDDELNQILDELTGNKHTSSLHAISIVGMGGMGKTTFAKNVYENSYIMQHFVIRAWATVSEQHDAKNILSQLLSTSGSVDSLGDQLHKTLSGRRYLIVLDDVWSVGAWDSVRRFFPDNGNKSRVVLTTRLSNVAVDCRSSLFRMNLLDEGKSWDLFCEKISIQDGDWPSPHLEEIGKGIVKQCKGLPLSIVVIGGLLRKAPRTVEHWEGVVREIKSIGNSKEKQDSLDVLSLSYYHLPHHLKPCFLYMGVFREDSQIRLSKIVKLWVSEGFIKIKSGQVLEEIAEGYLKDLIDRNLVIVGRLRKNGKIGYCGIHDLLRDLCIKLGEQQHFFHQGIVSYDYLFKIKILTDRRLFLRDHSGDHELPNARSILLWCSLSEAIIGRMVRVLDAQNLERLTELYGFVNLRYLAYDHPYDREHPSWKLPSSMSLIWNLQTLILKGIMSPIVVAPCEIWKMRQLRHVQCRNNIYLPDPPTSNNEEDALLVLDSLQTLKIVVNLRLSEKVCKMIPNIKKLHLVYDRNSQGYDDSLIECLCNLDRLHKLESLKLSVKSNYWPTRDPEMNKKLRCPSWLNKLSLQYCRLHWDDVTTIGSFPQLQVLTLGFESIGGPRKRWSPKEGQFQSLKFLNIDCCGRLHCWDTDSSHFPVLEKLLLRNLYSLEEIPLDIGNIQTLQLIRVDHCSESATISTVKIKEEQLENQGDDCQLQIQVKIYDTKLESFKERLETEGLALVSFQLEID